MAPPVQNAFESFGERLHRTGRLMRQRLVEELIAEGYAYPIEFFPTLKFLYRHPRAYQEEIAKFLVRDKATATRLLVRMEQAKLIVRTVDPQNRRRKMVDLTKQGRETFASLVQCANRVQATAVAELNPHHLSVCSQVLDRVFANLSNSPA